MNETEPFFSARERRRRRALEVRLAQHAREVREHLQAVWERTEANRRALDRLRRRATAH